MIGEYNKSVILTYIGVTISLFGMYFAFTGGTKYAFLCLIFAGICDLFDGVIARRCKRTESAKLFGIQLDSLADVLSFVAFPAVLCISVLGAWAFVCVPYVLAGIIRLAWFNVTTNNGGNAQYFQGLPVTYSALILPLYYLTHVFLSEQVFKSGLFIVYLAMSLFFVLNIKIKKPRGAAYVFFAVLAIATAVAILLV